MKLCLSVHQLVDFLLRSGDIDNRIFNRSTMNEGTAVHSRYQAMQSSKYISEFTLKSSFVVDDIEVELEGRADGIIKESENEYIIDEIKSTVTELEPFYENNKDWHLGQAKTYGYMFMKQFNLDHIGIRLTYIRQGGESDKKIYDFSFSYIELEQFVYDLLEKYLDFYNIIISMKQERDKYITAMKFPFSYLREGQKKLSKYVYGVAKKGGKLFVDAPTGIGKTISTLYPYIKCLPSNHDSKIFYLTAKGSGKDAAQNCLDIIDDDEEKISYVNITAKEKICLNKQGDCNPEQCPYAKHYYNKIANILRYALFNYHKFTYQRILSLAREFEVCPFELELDISNYVDILICDYNYVFDPFSYLKRFYDVDSTPYMLLVDEAHNLPDRSRNMYSQSLKEEDFLKVKKSIKNKSLKRLKTNFAKLGKRFNAIKEQCDKEYTIIEEVDELTLRLLNRFLDIMNDISSEEREQISEELKDFFLDVNRFVKLYEIADEAFLLYYHKEEEKITLNLICLDASKFIKSIINNVKCVTYFSATLSPINYYVQTLGGDTHLEPILMLDSPFDKEHLKVYTVPKVSVKYRNRENTYEIVGDYIKTFIDAKIGNYLIYVPSYEYLDNLLSRNKFDPSINILIQSPDMDELSKEEFLDHFIDNPTQTTIGFAVLGGAFGEGIDLVSDRLIGVVIIGVGMPKINFVSDQIKTYYDNNGLDGYHYAYLYPGMNKVMQAIGRVIRDENDIGAVLLIDERYALNEYRDLFTKRYRDYEMIFSTLELEDSLKEFYKKEE